MLKQEFEALLGVSVTVEEYSIIEYCYMNSDALFPADNKQEVARFYKEFGLDYFKKLKETIEVAKKPKPCKTGIIRYAETDFYRYEKPLMDQLRAEGKYIYTLHDADDGKGYSIRENGYCNRIGYLVTNKPLPLIGGLYLNDEDFDAITDKVEDRTVLETEKDMTVDVAVYKERMRISDKLMEEYLRLQQQKQEYERKGEIVPMYLEEQMDRIISLKEAI